MHKQKRKDTLVIIPARAGSKRLPRKNVKELEGKPLIQYSIDFAIEHFETDTICVTTDDVEVKQIAEQLGLDVPFMRPSELASDTSSSEDVLIHALDFYQERGKEFKYLLLLQPTSPFRNAAHLNKAYELFEEVDLEGVISVVEKKRDYQKLIVIDDENAFIDKPFLNNAEKLYEINGSLYLLKTSSLRKYHNIPQFKKMKKVVMSAYYSADIDTIDDWNYCKFIIKENLLSK